MISTRHWTGLLLISVLHCVAIQAAEPEFTTAIVTESRTYNRQSSSFAIAGIPAGGTTVSVSRVTVVMDGMLISGEWEPQTLRSATAKDFPRGDVLAAVTRNRLLLKLPDDSVVRAKIVKRERQKPPASDQPTRD